MPIDIQVGVVAKRQGLTIKSLAERAGVAYNTAHSLYTARATRIDLDTLDRLCGALGVEPGDLLIRHTTQETMRHTTNSGDSHDHDGERSARSGDRRTTGTL